MSATIAEMAGDAQVSPPSVDANSVILIADDSALSREALADLLEPEGYHLEFAVDGQDALAQAERLLPDLILLDVVMPQSSGIAVCHQLRRHPRLADVPILLITGLDDRESRLAGIRAGADDFITKPFDAMELRAQIRTITRLNRYRRLMEQQRRFQWVVEQDEDGFLLLSEADQILYANPQARLYLNLRPDDALPRDTTFLDLVRRHYRNEPQHAWQPWPAPAAAPLYLIRPETDRSDAMWLHVIVFDQIPGGESKRLVRLRDVTTSMVTMRNMRSFQALVMHKLSTPCQTMVSSLELLSQDAELGRASADASVDGAQLLALAQQGATRLQESMRQILRYADLSQLAHHGHEFALARLPSLVAETAQSCNLQPPTLRMAQAAPQLLTLSAPAMEWIVFELFANARKFHPSQDPHVEIAVSNPQPGLVRMTLRDDGVHLAPSQIAQVWQAYYQAEKGFTGEVPGMGLGLAMVASLLWEVNGACHFANREDQPGVVITLEIPVVETL